MIACKTNRQVHMTTPPEIREWNTVVHGGIDQFATCLSHFAPTWSVGSSRQRCARNNDVQAYTRCCLALLVHSVRSKHAVHSKRGFGVSLVSKTRFAQRITLIVRVE